MIHAMASGISDDAAMMQAQHEQDERRHDQDPLPDAPGDPHALKAAHGAQEVLP
jgi:hypothetical protein